MLPVLHAGGPALRSLITWSCLAALGCAPGCQGRIQGEPAPETRTDAGALPGKSPDAAAAPQTLDDCLGTTDVGTAPLRRLTRTEYERVVADVFGVEDAVGAGLAPDERIDGVFASNATTPVALLQVRQYLDAAESIAGKVQLDKLDRCDRAKLGDEACARQLIAAVGRRAYRRPLTGEEQTRYQGLYAQAKAEGHEPALRLVVQTLLQSPHLLYHMELDDPAQTPASGVARLPAFALASRLSFFLWSSAPDDALLDAAASGKLDRAAGLREQAERLLADPRAERGIAAFHEQWLGLSRLDSASRDKDAFPEWTPQLVSALRDEAVRFADHVIREQKGDLSLLLSAAYSYPSGPGLAIRGVDATGDAGRVELPAERAVGLLTQPAFLAAHAHSNQTSPILRGRALRERLFCQPLPDPPPTVAAVPPALAAGLTTRERYAAHRSAGAACASCHDLIDDLGFALEHFDAIGRYREREQGKPIDATGKLTATDVDGAFDGAGELAARMVDSPQVSRCYARQWLRFALGRGDSDRDRCSLMRVQDAFGQGAQIRDLLLAISDSDAFVRTRREP